MSDVNLYIVDDEPSVRNAFARLARSARMKAWTFGSVDEFLQANTPDKSACIICDIRMPGRSGLELPQLLAQAGRSLPIIFVTAHDTTEARQMAQQVGAAGFFHKPVDDQALLDAIAWALGSGFPKPKNRPLVR